MSQNLFEVTADNFQEQVLQSDLPVLVEFGADWCPPCKMLAPLLDEMAVSLAGKLRIGEIDSDVHPQLVEMFGVMGLPTLILFQKGQPVQKIVGYQPRSRIEAQIMPHLSLENA